MSLTGIPLIVLAILSCAAALAATIGLWDRGRRLRLLLRTLGVLFTEALLLLSVGLVANRSQQFYPSWATLLQTGSTTGTTYPMAPGHLDRWLRGYAGAHHDGSVAFTWQPAGWTGWHLAGAPTVVTPTAYLQHPGWRYSALLVIDNGTGGWSPTTEAAAARSAGRTAGAAIMVFARTTRTTSAHMLTTTLPAALVRDLRVTARRWALVASIADAGLARRAAAAPARYPAVAFVRGAAQQGPTNASHRTPVFRAAVATTALRTALVWACQQTPPPLAPSTPAVAYLPIHRRPKHLHPHPSATGLVPAPGSDAADAPSATIHSGERHVPGQPGA